MNKIKNPGNPLKHSLDLSLGAESTELLVIRVEARNDVGSLMFAMNDNLRKELKS